MQTINPSPMMRRTPEVPERKINFTLLISVAFAVVFLAAFVWALVGYLEAKKELGAAADSNREQTLTEEENRKLVEKVGRLMILPADETPVVATINNAEDLKKEQPFYKDAKDGDNVLIYTEERKAIIYDAIRNVIVNVGPIFINEEAKTAEAAKPLAVEVRNGSGVPGVGTRVANELKKDATLNVFEVANASLSDYEGTVVVDMTAGAKEEAVKALADSLKAQIVTVLPPGERTTAAEALIIVGK